MSLVIGISGPQGAGKSSLLKELSARGYYVDNFKVSRQVQSDFRFDSLEQAVETPDMMMAFQNEVFRRKYEHDKANKQRKSEYVLTERSFADIVAYASVWAWKFEFDKKMTTYETLEFLAEFTKKCVVAQEEIYGGTILLPWMDHMVWESDKKRASRKDINIVYTNILSFLQSKELNRHNILTVTAQSIEDRADQIEDFLRIPE
jgi:predicted ATPase